MLSGRRSDPDEADRAVSRRYRARDPREPPGARTRAGRALRMETPREVDEVRLPGHARGHDAVLDRHDGQPGRARLRPQGRIELQAAGAQDVPGTPEGPGRFGGEGA